MDRHDEHRELCRMLERLTPGLLPRDVFHAIARIMVTTTFVVVPLVQRDERTLVLLRARDGDDLSYPSMLNVPGTVIRASDANLHAAHVRLIATELADVPIKRDPVFVGNVYDLIARGREVSLIHWVELDNAIESAELCDSERLPDHIVPRDRHRIDMAVAHFRAQKHAEALVRA
ncbi:hypothetical protein [Microvirga alba]|uniref:NUDIX hydrolase n=1 Tax=Microvirga alba TaxID=2791025 RepID=A0A931BSD3_9HYPH|nr:hypothetical protein [Microvirga alba]MBF9234834.1 hypothetical protein [Microvirga alba]